MSYDVQLVDKESGESVTIPQHAEGGTIVSGGIDIAEINITYNYSTHFKELDKEKGIRWLYGKTGKECIDRLQAAVIKLGVVKTDYHWDPTPGNAGFALSILLAWARQHPDAEFRGD